MSDYYELLGVSRNATAEEIKRAYRRLARELHPDANPGDADAESRFKELSRAYEVLSDPQRRANYDRFGTDEPRAGGDPFGFSDVSDIFDAFFGASPFGGGSRTRGPTGPPRGPDLEVTVDLEFTEAVFGVERDVEVRSAVRCETCGGSGAAEGSGPTTCHNCDGMGQVRRVRQSILGQMVTSAPCDVCGGSGEVIADPCADCRGEGRIVEEVSYQIKVPPGVDNGSTLRLSGRGAVGQRGGAPGDLYVHLRVADHPDFERHGDELHTVLPVSMAQAALGAHLELVTLDGPESIHVEPGTQSGTIVRLRSRGVHRLEGRGRGDMVVTLVVETPSDLDDEQVDLLRRLAELRGEDVAEPGEGGLLGRIKSAFR